MPPFTQELLREFLDYDPATGIFTWRKRASNNVSVGSRAGCVKSQGYRMIGLFGASYGSHRLAWFYMTGEWPEEEIDHRDTIKDHDWFDNLRKSTRSQNQANLPAPATSTSGVKGASWHARCGKWQAQITVSGHTIYLGLFATAAEAGEAYREAATEHFGEYARSML